MKAHEPGMIKNGKVRAKITFPVSLSAYSILSLQPLPDLLILSLQCTQHPPPQKATSALESVDGQLCYHS